MRQIKSPGQLAFLKEAIDLSLDSTWKAMKLMHPGLYEYQVRCRWSTSTLGRLGSGRLRPDWLVPVRIPRCSITTKLSRKIGDGDIVVMDVGAQYSGYSATSRAPFPPTASSRRRQREIYSIVLGAQNAALAALKPGMDFCGKNGRSVQKIAYNYIDTHGKDLHGKSLGPYFIHGLASHRPERPRCRRSLRPFPAWNGHHR